MISDHNTNKNTNGVHLKRKPNLFDSKSVNDLEKTTIKQKNEEDEWKSYDLIR